MCIFHTARFIQSRGEAGSCCLSHTAHAAGIAHSCNGILVRAVDGDGAAGEVYEGRKRNQRRVRGFLSR